MILTNKSIRKINLFNRLIYKTRSADGYFIIEEVIHTLFTLTFRRIFWKIRNFIKLVKKFLDRNQKL